MPIILFLPAFSQTQAVNPGTGMPNTFPVGPKAFEFLKYAEIPVSKYTGVPAISIPIYTIKSNAMEIPINLSYHSNGFRVSEEAGWTGLGWTLNGGGSIVQVVNGFDDFSIWFQKVPDESQAMVNAAVASGTGIPSSILNTCTPVNFASVIPVEQNGAISPPPPGFFNYAESMNSVSGLKDADVDIFKFSMPGYTGEFVMNWSTNSFQCLSDKNILVAKVGSGFIITTPDGNNYSFTLMEETSIGGIARYGQGNSAPILEVSSHIIGEKVSRVYQLTAIQTATGDQIAYNYTQTAMLENLPSISHSQDWYRFVYGPTFGGPTSVDPASFFPNYPVSTTVNYTHQVHSYLSSIVFPSGKIQFNTSSGRTDFIGTQRLDSISIFDKNNNLVNGFSMIYSYFTGRTDGNNTDVYLSSQSPVYNTNKQASELNTRLQLNSIQEAGKPPYIFSYDPEPLPKKTSLATDFWGYYNERLSNIDLLPNIYMCGIVDNNLTGINNNRNSNLPGTRAAVLNNITYPTGGSAGFQYELNSFGNYKVPNDSQSTVSSVFLNDRNNAGDPTGQIFSADMPSVLYGGQLNISTFGPHSSFTNSTSAYIRLTILKKTAANISLTNAAATFWPMYNATYLGNPNAQLSAHVNDIVSDGTLLQFVFNSSTNSYPTSSLLNNVTVNLDPANIYIVQAYLDDAWGAQTNGSSGAGASAYFTFIRNMNYSSTVGAGLRVKTIKTIDPTSPPIVKNYVYHNGKLMSPLIFMTRYKYDWQYGYNFDTGDPYHPVALASTKDSVIKTSTNSSSFYSMSTNASGKYVGYDTVEEYNSILDTKGGFSIAANGKVLEMYTNQPDTGVMDPSFLPSPSNPDAFNPVDFYYPARKAPLQNGLLTRRQVFNQNQFLLEQTDNFFTPTPTNCIYGRVSAWAGQYLETIGVGMIYNLVYYRVGFFPISYNKSLLTSTTKTNFNGNVPGGGNSFAVTQNNYYDSYDLLNRSSYTDSKQNTVNTNFKHPYDYTATDDGGLYLGPGGMVVSRFLTPVIETSIQRNALPASSTKVLYQPVSGMPWPVFMPQKTQSANGSYALEDDIVYDQYGAAASPSKCKPQQYHDRTGLTTTVLWGYNGQYPVAKVTGSSYSTVAALVSQSILDNPADDNTMRTELNKIRTGLAATVAQVSTYTYAPLTGMTSQTDPRGYTSYYTYDAFHRLFTVQDKDKNILKEYNYGFGVKPVALSQVPVTATNSNSTAWNITFFDNSGNYNQSFVINASLAATQIASIPTGTYNIYLSPVAGGDNALQLNINGIVYSQNNGSFSISNLAINSSTSVTLVGPPPYTTACPFTMSSNLTNITNAFASNGTSVQFHLVFNPNATIGAITPITVGHVSGSCIPSAYRSFTFTNAGVSWLVEINTDGTVRFTLPYGSPPFSGVITTGTSLYYNL